MAVGGVVSNGRGCWVAASLPLRATPRGVHATCKRWQGSFFSAVTWTRSLFSTVNAAGVNVDIRTSSCTSLVQLSSDPSVHSHSRHACNSFPTFGLSIKGAALCHRSDTNRNCNCSASTGTYTRTLSTVQSSIFRGWQFTETSRKGGLVHRNRQLVTASDSSVSYSDK